MVKENHEFEEDQFPRSANGRASVLVSEVLRRAGPRTDPPADQEKMSLFWQIFGGTIVSVVALILITAYTQITSAAMELRRDVNRLQAEVITKDDLNGRLTAVWNTVKDLQATKNSLSSLQEQVHALNQDLGARTKADEDRRRELQRQLDEQSRRLQALAERVAAVEATCRAAR
jgi:hypothetical protein